MNILIAQIGRGNYIDTKYVRGRDINDKSIEGYDTGYTFDATLHELAQSSNGEKQNLILIGTEKSFWGTLCYYFYSNRAPEIKIDKRNENDNEQVKQENQGKREEIVRILQENIPDVEFAIEEGDIIVKDINNEEVREKIEKFLQNKIEIKDDKGNNIIKDINVKIVIIKSGINDEELNENFNKLYESTEDILNKSKGEDKQDEKEKINIVFDISNGFRSIPMYIYNFMNYLLRVRDEKFELEMYYGMSDAKVESKAPLVNLNSVNELMRWINAANEFINYGAVREIIKILEKSVDKKNESITEIIENFNKFDYSSNANNLTILKDSIEFISNLSEYIKGIGDDILPKYAKILLDRISNEFNERFNQSNKNPGLKYEYSYSFLTIKLAKWYMEQGRTGNAAIALQEGITTFIMERWPDEIKGGTKFKKDAEDDKIKNDEFVKWLFDYNNREEISKQFNEKNSDIKDDKCKEFLQDINIVRKYIRNPEAHILLQNDITMDEIKEYQVILKNRIYMMERIISNENNSDEEILKKFEPKGVSPSFLEFIEKSNKEFKLDDTYKNEDWYCGWKELCDQYNDYVKIYDSRELIDKKIEKIKKLTIIINIRKIQCQKNKGINDDFYRSMLKANSNNDIKVTLKNYIFNNNNKQIYEELCNYNKSN